jgi:26S proteasome regulatory subunit N13
VTCNYSEKTKLIFFCRASSSSPDAAAAVRNFLDSLRGQSGLAGAQQQQQQHQADISYPYLSHLLPTSITVPIVDTLSAEQVDSLLSFLPPAVIVLASDTVEYDGISDPTADQIRAANDSLSLEKKQTLLKKVLRSPQFHQALGTLTMALRDGGLPSIADALNIKVEQDGYLQPGMPMGGNSAIKVFIEGVKKTVKDNKQ